MNSPSTPKLVWQTGAALALMVAVVDLIEAKWGMPSSKIVDFDARVVLIFGITMILIVLKASEGRHPSTPRRKRLQFLVVASWIVVWLGFRFYLEGIRAAAVVACFASTIFFQALNAYLKP